MKAVVGGIDFAIQLRMRISGLPINEKHKAVAANRCPKVSFFFESGTAGETKSIVRMVRRVLRSEG